MQEAADKRKIARGVLQGVWSVTRAAVIFLCGIMIVAAIFLYAYHYVDSHYISPPGAQAAPPQEVIITKGMSLNSIALLLEEKNLVRSAKAFKYLVDFSGYGSRIKAGGYVLDGSMTMQQIMDKLARGMHAAPVTSFIIIEGSTAEQIAAQLQKQKIIANTGKFLELCKSGSAFSDYAFVQQAIATKSSSERRYMLEGYLFPAKYEIYVGATEEDIIRKMLAKTGSVMSDAYLARAAELGFTFDQVLTLASIIEREGKPADFAKISAVFHNRLANNTRLDSDVTVAYAVSKTGFNITAADIASDSPYNTRKFKGLPLGPISSPGEQAIKAALYPDPQYVQGKYMYFYLTNPDTGVIEYYKTLKEFNAGVAKYKPIWDAYNKKHGG
jgi:UPF0755 protein